MSSAEKLMVPSAAIRLGNRLLRRPVKSCAGQIGSGSSVPLYTYVRVRELITPSATHNVVSISPSEIVAVPMILRRLLFVRPTIRSQYPPPNIGHVME